MVVLYGWVSSNPNLPVVNCKTGRSALSYKVICPEAGNRIKILTIFKSQLSYPGYSNQNLSVMKLAYIGTYPPRECGIGTFTMNLYKSMVMNKKIVKGSIEGFVIALNDHEQTYDYPEEVKLTIRQEHQRDYLSAVKFINLSGADLCILEHEFGIFGGQNGVYILPLLHRLEIPLVVTLHTIIKTPSYNEKAILVEICKMANKIVLSLIHI